jgi:hypothetical protein
MVKGKSDIRKKEGIRELFEAESSYTRSGGGHIIAAQGFCNPLVCNSGKTGPSGVGSSRGEVRTRPGIGWNPGNSVEDASDR